MIREWFQNNIFIYIIVGICALGLLVKFAISMKYRVLIRASRRMGTSKNKLMRVLRLKFETCYKLKIGVNNVDTFVDKYVYRHRFCGLHLYTWETLSGEFVVLSILSASIFGVLGLINKCGQEEVLSTFVAGLLSAVVLIAYDFYTNLNMKRKILKVNIKDYLENFLKSRLESAEFSSDLLEQYKKEYFDLPNAKTKGKKKKNDKRQPMQPGISVQAETAATKAVEKSKQETKPSKEEKKDAATLRREAKKNELKKMIQEDKESRKKKEELLSELESPRMLKLEKVEDELPQKEDATAVSKEIAKEPSEITTDQVFDISSEEAKIIEDILKEYLA